MSDEIDALERLLVGAGITDNALLSCIRREDLADGFCYDILGTALSLHARGIPVDLASLVAERPDLDVAQVARLTDEGGLAPASFDYYREKVEGAARLRRARRELEAGLEAIDRGDEAAVVRVAEALGKLEQGGAAWSRVKVVSAREEQAAEIPARVWFIEGVFTIGLNIVSARKGMGKSFFVFQGAAAIPAGGTFLGRRTTRARCLCIELELDRLAMHERAARMPPLPEGLDIVYAWPRGDEALALLEAAITEGGYRVVVIDMLGGILPPDIETNSYDLSPWLLRLRHVALDHGAAIIALHHSTKGDSGDPVSNLMGSTAFGGQADSIIAIERKRGEPGAKIYIAGNHGRDNVIKARFDDCRWIPIDDEDEDAPRLGESERGVIQVLEAHPEGLSASIIGATLGKPGNWARAVLSKLGARGLAIKKGSSWLYTPQPQPGATVAPVAPWLFDGEAQRNATAPLGALRRCAPEKPQEIEADP